jgi:hypothetical protein
MPETPNPREPSFWLTTDPFLIVWAANQKAVDDAGGAGSMSDEELYRNYRSLCLNLFDRLCREKNSTGQLVNPQATIDGRSELQILKDKKASKQEKDDAKYEFMKDRVKAKCESLMVKLKKNGSKAKFPHGLDQRNWYKSGSADWKKRAGYFG